MRLPIDPEGVKGFLAAEEGRALYDACLAAAAKGPALEVGSYCGKSALYLGEACREGGTCLFAVDHHRGSEEHQPGEAYHDPALYDAAAGCVDSFREFRKTLAAARLEEVVVPIVAPSAVAARHWRTPLGFLFIDGGHSLPAALADYHGWACHLAPGGALAIHDIFEDPQEGGQAPLEILKLARASGHFTDERRVKTLVLLTRR